MAHRIGLRLEDKNVWERRVALTPEAVGRLTNSGVEIWVEAFAKRCFSDQAYTDAGAKVVDDVRDCEIVFGIKEMPHGYFREGGAYMFFSHTIKGQAFNMPSLKEVLDKKCTLIDYECVTNDEGFRLIFFSRHAGRVGTIDSLWTLGQRLEAQGVSTPLSALQPAHRYSDLEDAKRAVTEIGKRIASEGIPAEAAPMVIGLTGGGNVAAGSWEILDCLPHEKVEPSELPAWLEKNADATDRVAVVHLLPDHFVEPVDAQRKFDFQEYVDHPELYRACFAPWLSHLSLLIHGVYWDDRYPVLASREDLAALFADGATPRLKAIGDITCDIEGSIKCTVRDTEPGDPVYIYDPVTGESPFGFEGPGIAVMAVGNLPTELPIEASQTFSDALEAFVPEMASAKLDGALEDSGLPMPIQRGVIAWNGKLVEKHAHLAELLP